MQMSVDGLKEIDQRILDFLQQSSSLTGITVIFYTLISGFLIVISGITLDVQT